MPRMIWAGLIAISMLALNACGKQPSSQAQFRETYATTFMDSCVQPRPHDPALAKGCGCAIKAILAKYPSNEQLNAVETQLNSGAVSPEVRGIFATCFPKPKTGPKA